VYGFVQGWYTRDAHGFSQLLTRFSREDVDTVESIRTFFGDSIADHMILVFTNGDQVDENTLKKMLSDKRATYLQVFIISVQCCFARFFSMGSGYEDCNYSWSVCVLSVSCSTFYRSW
jgi:hypothetical protein